MLYITPGQEHLIYNFKKYIYLFVRFKLFVFNKIMISNTDQKIYRK